MMHRTRVVSLGLILGVFLLLTSWVVYREYRLRSHSFLAGAPPEDVRKVLIPRTIDLNLMRPPALRPSDPMRYGDINSLASVFEFGDYECDGCRVMAATIKKVVPEFKGKVRFVWRDLPVQDSHPHAMDAAIFARCAGLQGKYWEAHDALLATTEINASELGRIASQIGLAKDALAECQKDPLVRSAIEEDVKTSRADGINAVPFLFIGTKAYGGQVSETELRDALRAFIEP